MIGALIMGALVGWIAGKLMNIRGGLLRNIIVGVAGSFVGSAVFGALGFFMRMVFLPSCWWALRAHACSSGSGGSCSAEGTAPSSPKAGTIRGLGPNGSNGFFDRYSAGDPEKGSPALCGSRRPAARKGTLRGLCAAAAPPGFSTASKARSARRRGR